jgi:hypothetical protein
MCQPDLHPVPVSEAFVFRGKHTSLDLRIGVPRVLASRQSAPLRSTSSYGYTAARMVQYPYSREQRGVVSN